MNINELLKDNLPGMSKFQDDWFVTGKAGTIYGQYKQALRELSTRVKSLRDVTMLREKMIIDIDELVYKSSNLENKFDRRRAKVDLAHKSSQLPEFDDQIRDITKEATTFYSQAIYLKGVIGELTDEKRYELEQELFTFKAKEMVVIDLVTAGKVSASSYSMVNSLPPAAKKEIINGMANHIDMIKWYEEKEDFKIPKNLADTIKLIDVDSFIITE